MNQREPIRVVFNANCPWPDSQFEATFGDYDLDDPVGYGSTQEEAIEDLKWRVNEEDDDETI